MSNLLNFAKQELELAGYTDDQEDGPNKWMKDNVLQLIETFSEQGHSGSSAPFCIGLFKQLANYEPINPVKGTQDEWLEIGDGVFQNKREGALFHENKTGNRPYYLDAIVWREPNGVGYCGTVEGITSRQFVKFPFRPKTFYVNVVEITREDGTKENIIPNKSELKEVIEYYETDILEKFPDIFKDSSSFSKDDLKKAFNNGKNAMTFDAWFDMNFNN